MKITFVIPVYNERDTLEALVEAIHIHAAPHSARILLIDDGSTDGSHSVMGHLQKRFDSVEVIPFRRNFGKSAALAAGFARADGDLVFTMDADLQDDPKEIPRFIEKINEGYDLVSGWKTVRHDPWHKTLASRIFNRVTSRLFRLPLHDINCGFKAYRLDVVKKIPMYGELHRLTPALAAALGFRVAEISVAHHPRRFGRSKYGFERFSRGALDVLTVWFLSRHLNCPGHFFGKLGLGLMFLGAVGIATGAIMRLLLAARGSAITLILGGVVAVLGGVVILCQGLIAELIVRRLPPTDPAVYIGEEEEK